IADNRAIRKRGGLFSTMANLNSEREGRTMAAQGVFFKANQEGIDLKAGTKGMRETIRHVVLAILYRAQQNGQNVKIPLRRTVLQTVHSQITGTDCKSALRVGNGP